MENKMCIRDRSIDICVARKAELVKTLIVCGVNSVKYNWEKEIKKHSKAVSYTHLDLCYNFKMIATGYRPARV